MRFGVRGAPEAAIVLLGAAAVWAQATSVDQVAWLQGCWQSTRGESIVEEHWMAPRGGSLLGMSRTVRNGTVTAYELVVITAQDGRLAFQAHPSGQPTATFRSVSTSDGSIVFENPDHDFPQRVGYRRNGADGLDAWIEGRMGAQSRRIDFAYRRARCDAP